MHPNEIARTRKTINTTIGSKALNLAPNDHDLNGMIERIKVGTIAKRLQVIAVPIVSAAIQKALGSPVPCSDAGLNMICDTRM